VANPQKASKMSSFAFPGGLFLEVKHFLERCFDQGQTCKERLVCVLFVASFFGF
jgi:hypothetical protein